VNLTCPKCDGSMETGHSDADGLMGTAGSIGSPSRLIFVLTKVATSLNPIKAFRKVVPPCSVAGFRCGGVWGGQTLVNLTASPASGGF
jgi:hypothetical protein